MPLDIISGVPVVSSIPLICTVLRQSSRQARSTRGHEGLSHPGLCLSSSSYLHTRICPDLYRRVQPRWKWPGESKIMHLVYCQPRLIREFIVGHVASYMSGLHADDEVLWAMTKYYYESHEGDSYAHDQGLELGILA
jgi:hypothetical protein